jgi:hypothetical protein
LLWPDVISRCHIFCPDGIDIERAFRRRQVKDDQKRGGSPPSPGGSPAATPSPGRKRWLSRQVGGQTKAPGARPRRSKPAVELLREESNLGGIMGGGGGGPWASTRQPLLPAPSGSAGRAVVGSGASRSAPSSPVNPWPTTLGRIDRLQIHAEPARPAKVEWRSRRGHPRHPLCPGAGDLGASARSAGKRFRRDGAGLAPGCATGPDPGPRRRLHEPDSRQRLAGMSARGRPEVQLGAVRAPSSKAVVWGWTTHKPGQAGDPPAGGRSRWYHPNLTGRPCCSPPRWTRTRSWAVPAPARGVGARAANDRPQVARRRSGTRERC